MINIIGDTYQELADLQTIIESGINNTEEKLSVTTRFELRSGDILLANQYNHIVGSKARITKPSRCDTCQNNTDELSGECYECVKGIEDWYEPISELKG